jgi:hypothetical protein
MSLQVLAQDMASRGRGGDTMLVHMAPSEVAGLQALAMAKGGSLTINPDTGLPEANILKRFLPMLIGAGLTAMTGGAGAALIPGLSNAATIGLGVGGLEAARTGSLRKGLMAGLGAYGGAGMMGGVMGAGTGAMNTAATENILQANPGQMAASGTLQPAIAPSEIAREMGSFSPVTGSFQPASGFVQPEIAISANPATATPIDITKAGVKAIADKPSLLLNKENLKYGAAALAPMMFQEPNSAQAPRDTEQFRYAYSPGPLMPPTRAGSMGEYTYFRPGYTRLAAGGGLMDLPVERMSDRNDAMMSMANGGQMYAGGGISHLGDYSDGGRLLRGPGDGVSDDIPATIGQKQPARLADGEFVVPARIVSELGNGSTEAGARKLYSMMDRVQNARRKTVGKDKVAVNSRSEKLLPA